MFIKFILLGIGAGFGYAMTRAALSYASLFLFRLKMGKVEPPIPQAVFDESTDKHRWRPTRADNFRSDVADVD